MASFELRVRRIAVVADAAFVIAVAAMLAIAIASRGDFWPPSVLVVALSFGLVVVAHIGRSLLTAQPESRRIAAHGVIWLSNAGVLAMVFLVYQVIFPPVLFGGGLHDHEPSRWLGLPLQAWVTGVGIAAVVIGRYWIHRILQDGREPESNDRFWWSRA